MKGTPASLAAPAARNAAARMPCNVQAPIRRVGRDDWIETALMLVSVGCEVDSEENLRGWPPSQQTIYSDNIHRLARYFGDRQKPAAMDVAAGPYRDIPRWREPHGAHAFPDLIGLGWLRWLVEPERGRSEFDNGADLVGRASRCPAGGRRSSRPSAFVAGSTNDRPSSQTDPGSGSKQSSDCDGDHQLLNDAQGSKRLRLRSPGYRLRCSDH